MNQWETYLCENNNQAKTETIDYFYPNATNLANTLVNDCTINGKKTYVRVLIRRKGVYLWKKLYIQQWMP